MILDLENLPLDQYISLYIFEEERTWERLAEIMVELDELMEENNLHISKYTISLRERGEEGKIVPQESLGVYDFPQELVKSQNLAKVLEEFFNKYNK